MEFRIQTKAETEALRNLTAEEREEILLIINDYQENGGNPQLLSDGLSVEQKIVFFLIIQKRHVDNDPKWLPKGW